MDMDMVRPRKDPWGLSPVGGPWEAWGSLMDLCGRSRRVGPPRPSCDAYVGRVCHCRCGGDRSSRHPVRLVWVNGSFGCRTIAARTRGLILDTIHVLRAVTAAYLSYCGIPILLWLTEVRCDTPPLQEVVLGTRCHAWVLSSPPQGLL